MATKQIEQTETQTANKAEASKPSAVLFDANTRERFNPQVRDELVSFIRVQMRSGEGIYKRLFGFIRQCGDYSTATGTVHGAEKQVCKDEKVKNLNQLNKARDMALSSYITVKSSIFSAMEQADDLCEAQQALYNWLEENEKANKVILPKGYLDIFSDRYGDPVKGAASFRKDANEAKAAAATLEQKRRAASLAAQKALENAQANGQTVAQTPAQMGSGGGQSESNVKLPADWQNGVNEIKFILGGMSKSEGLTKGDWSTKVVLCLQRVIGALKQIDTDYVISLKAGDTSTTKPNKAAAELEGEPHTGTFKVEEPELPVVDDNAEMTPQDEKLIEEMGPADATGTGE